MSRRVREDWWDDADIDRAQIFVPAIMGAGILISGFTLVRDALHGRRRRGRDRRTALHARGTAAFVRAGADADSALVAGLRPRVHYLLLALSAGAVAGYGGRGATKNYLQPEGLFGGSVGWMYAALLVGVAGLATIGITSAVTFVTWPAVPRWQHPLLARTPLGQRPADPGEQRPGRVLLLGWAAVLTAVAATQFVFTTAGAPQLLTEVDDELGAGALTDLPWDHLGDPAVGIGLAVLVGFLTRRCPPFALGQLTVVTAAYVLHALFTDVVERAHPPDGPLAGMTDSLPSGPMLQAALLAGMVPLAVYVRMRRRRPALLALAVTGPALLAFAVVLVRDRFSWPSDVVAGGLVGLALVLATWWALEHPGHHARCESCPWAPTEAPAARQGLLPIGPARESAIRRGSRAWLAAMIALLGALALVEGLPTSPDGETMGADLARPIQLGLLGLAAVALLVSFRWPAVAAALAAVAGTALAVFAAVTYQPWVSLLVAVAFLAPAVGLWLAWQHRRTLRAVTTLALVTALLVAGTYGAASAVYDTLYGPAHPQSATLALPVDAVVWSWSGGVTSRSAVVVAEIADSSGTARLVVEPESGGPAVGSGASAASPDGVVRLSVDGLEPDTVYRYAVEVDGTPDSARGTGRFRTFPEGPASFTLAVGACARTGSNGAVFDAIRGVDPLLYVAAGDLHYANITGNDVARFGDRYRDVLTAPAQSALYRSVPTSYVWGDHDFGGDNSDSSTPSAPAADAAYRAYVPHHDLAGGPGDGIYQAFTVGRVRVVLTDTRSQRTTDSMLGARQVQWLEEELVSAARDHALVVWVNPDPWVAPAGPGRDDWGGYVDERRRLADVIAGAGIDNLVMVSGDAHMVAVDDGTNTDYSTAGAGAFPLLHAAALDRPGSVKGGPYSEGAFPGAGQFGTVEVTDTGGDSVEVELSGRNWHGDVLVSLHVTVPAGDDA